MRVEDWTRVYPGQMATPGMRMTNEKRLALADCKGLLERRSHQLEEMVQRGRESGLDVYEVEDLLPLTTEVVTLRQRRFRLELELRAIAAEWAVDI